MSTAPAALRRETAVFIRAFDDAPELASYSNPARRVLAAAAALFHQQGAAATSIRHITTECSLTPGAFYRHFASKDDVLFILVTHGHERMERRIADALAAADPSRTAQLAAFVRAYVGGHLEAPELAQVVRREYLHLSPARHAAVVGRRRALRTHLARLLADGATSNEFDLPGGAANSTRVAVMLLDMCSRTAEWYHRANDRTPEELIVLYVGAALRLAGAVVRDEPPLTATGPT